MKKILFVVLICMQVVNAFATDHHHNDTILKSIEYVGKISGHPLKPTDKLCKLVIQLLQFTNDSGPVGPIKFQHVDFQFYTAENQHELDSKTVHDAQVISRINVASTLVYSDESALPMKTGKQNKSMYDGKILTQKESHGSHHDGKSFISINQVSSQVFDKKPFDVEVYRTKGHHVPVQFEADFKCEL